LLLQELHQLNRANDIYHMSLIGLKLLTFGFLDIFGP